jgi:starvation-inducible DNA-binding protein
MKPNLGIGDKDLAAVVKLLEVLLADLHVLYVKTHNFHWNVEGPHFNDLHKVFDEQYEALGEEIDEVAERIRALGAPVAASLATFAKGTRLKEHIGPPPVAPRMVTELLADHEALVRSLRADQAAAQDKHGDAGTADFLIGLMESHEKTAWMLRATAEK